MLPFPAAATVASTTRRRSGSATRARRPAARTMSRRRSGWPAAWASTPGLTSSSGGGSWCLINSHFACKNTCYSSCWSVWQLIQPAPRPCSRRGLLDPSISYSHDLSLPSASGCSSLHGGWYREVNAVDSASAREIQANRVEITAAKKAQTSHGWGGQRGWMDSQAKLVEDPHSRASRAGEQSHAVPAAAGDGDASRIAASLSSSPPGLAAAAASLPLPPPPLSCWKTTICSGGDKGRAGSSSAVACQPEMELQHPAAPSLPPLPPPLAHTQIPCCIPPPPPTAAVMLSHPMPRASRGSLAKQALSSSLAMSVGA